MKGRPKGSKATHAQAKAGAENLRKWQEEEGHGLQNLKHGRYSTTVRQRYSDLRTSEGRRLKAVIDALVHDLGGPEGINAAQNVLMGGLRSKFIVVFQIGNYLDKQTRIIDPHGELLACLSKDFLRYTESIRRDLETLYSISGKARRQVPKLQDLINKGNA